MIDLPETPQLSDSERRRLEEDFERFRDGLPTDLRAHVRETHGLDIAGEYAGRTVRNPFGKASGQLSLNARQVRRDADAQLGFVVLKTVIAEDAGGGQSMAAWAIPETHMRVERITAPSGREGWTVTWKGRGWSDTLAAYCDLLRQAAAIGDEVGMPVAPSVKYHLPAPGEGEFRVGEYQHTTALLQAAWQEGRDTPMPLEKDFSPTLAGDDRSREQQQILTWLERVPDLIRESAAPPGVVLGIKLMNARFDDAFQVEMARRVIEGPRTPPDFLIYANRLFDPGKEFEGKIGVAYGGPELSERNLRCLELLMRSGVQAFTCSAGLPPGVPTDQKVGATEHPTPNTEYRIPISATGDILTGRTSMLYGLRGATSCQMHTLFQLPDGEFAARTRNKTEAVLHHLLFHPTTGLIAWLLHLRRVTGQAGLNWMDLPKVGLAAVEGSA
jgi:hypothetical protein